ncbi:MAG: hypothetical protein K8F25_06525, partial [Fimbriimonadaceae bacterium]|nr:hypothetical protein [Alphaproteobacteria bacterium]
QILWKITTGWRGKMAYYSVILGGGIHLIDLLRWLVDDEVTEISGMANNIFSRDSNYRFDDTTVNLLRFKRGTLGKVFVCFGPQRPQLHALNLYGTRRTFLNDVPDAKLFDGDLPENETRVRTPYPGMEKGDLLPDFIAAIRAGREPEVGARDVFRVMDICLAAIDAIETRRVVPVSYMMQ